MSNFLAVRTKALLPTNFVYIFDFLTICITHSVNSCVWI